MIAHESDAAEPSWDGGRPLRVLIVEDHALMADSLAYALRLGGIDVEVGCGPERSDVLAMASATTPDVVLLDLMLGPLGYGLDYIRPLVDMGCRVVMLTHVDDDARLAECIEAGAAGVVAKSRSFDDLVESLQRLIATGDLISLAERYRLQDALRLHRETTQRAMGPFERLSPREEEIMELMCLGMSAAQIADETFVSVSTVRSHIRSILQKLEVHSQLAAVGRAVGSGWKRSTANRQI